MEIKTIFKRCNLNLSPSLFCVVEETRLRSLYAMGIITGDEGPGLDGG